MSLYRRGDVWHYDFTINGARYRGSTNQLSKTAARKVEERERERAALGRAYDAIPTLEQAAAQWFRSRAEGRKSVKTIAQRVKIMLALVGKDRLVTEIGTADIEAAMQARRLQTTRQGKLPTNSTVNRDIIDTTLRPILRYCEQVLELPVRRIAWAALKLQEPKGRVRTFTPDEIAAWRAALPAWHRPVFDFLKRYGVRLREAFFGLDAFDGDAEMVTIRQRKNGLAHVVRLLPEDARDIAARLGRAKAAGLDTVWFRETKRGKLTPIHWRGFQSASKAAQKAAGIMQASPVHDLRHHAATAALRAPRGNLKTVQRLLGHETIASTARYAHADDDDVLEALRHVSATEAASAQKNNSDDNGLPNSETGT